MNDLINTAALLVTAAAVVSAAAALLATSRITTALQILLDMLLAASLLRLILNPTPTQLAGTALLILIKRLASSGVSQAAAARLVSRRSPYEAPDRHPNVIRR